MARITALETTALSGETEAILKEIEGAFGMVPNLFKTYAQHATCPPSEGQLEQG